MIDSGPSSPVPVDHLAELREAVGARRAEIESSGLSAQQWLDRRWDELNAEQPPAWMSRDVTVGAVRGGRDAHLIAVPLILQGGRERLWGDVNNRPESYRQIVQGLLDDPFEQWYCRMGRVSLERYDGPFGPTYAVCSDGRHRVHAAKALELPYLSARVDQGWESPGAGAEVSGTDRKHMSLVADLGLITDLRHFPSLSVATLVCDLEIPWALEPPESVCRISRDYAAVYPRYRTTRFYELTADKSAARTMEYLAEVAPSSEHAGKILRRRLKPRAATVWQRLGRVLRRR